MPGNQWSPDSWRGMPIKQQPSYPDSSQDDFKRCIKKIKQLPPLVHSTEIDELNAQLAAAVRGEVFLIQGGDCVEMFHECNKTALEAKLKILLQMALIVTYTARIPVLKIGRIGGQYGKPRSSPTEKNAKGEEVMSFKGENINGYEATVESRTHDPNRLLEAHFHSAATLNYIRALVSGKYADLHQSATWDLGEVKDKQKRTRYGKITSNIVDALDFLETVGLGGQTSHVTSSTDLYFSHEGLVLDYESAVTEKVDNKWYNLGAHFIWIGNRTRQIDHAHVEYFRGIQNPIGIKVGPKMPPLELIELINILNPDKIVGKITLITRYGAKNVAKILPTHIKAIQQAGLQDVVLWSCDPMHGNTYKTENGYKTRAVESIVQELVNTFQCHLENGSRLGGIHVELTGENVTECVGGPQNLIFHDLEERYVTYCDPRLNYMQAMEVSFLVAGLLKTKTTGDEDDRLRDVNRVKRILNNNGGLKSRL